MRWSLKIGRVSGIGLYLHVTLLLLFALIGYAGFVEMGTRGAVWALALVASVLACILLHELGHSLIAQRLGVQVRSITLLPIGGVAALKGIPEKPWHEIAITLSGPTINLAIAAVLLPFTGQMPRLFAISMPHDLSSFLATMVNANLTLFVFNFIPAFPMDGGRLLRAVLALVMSFPRATVIAATVGQVLAIGFVLVGLKFSLWLVIIGVFIFFGAEGEEKVVRTRGLLRDLVVEEVMARDFVVLAPTATVMRGLEMVYHTGQDDFPVMDGDRLLGIVTRQDMLDTANQRGPDTPVVEAMDSELPPLPPHTRLSDVYETMMTEGYQSLPVVQDDRLIGLLSHDNISRYLLVQSGLKPARRRAAGRTRTPAPPPVIRDAPPVAVPRSPATPPPPASPS
ncbi:MAG: site-2 protease family protein [Verrucomicrobia bacterium]|nr:site-2 protease family protein [Verrucomicrobiota bacterium]